jgi:hypothetical protein
MCCLAAPCNTPPQPSPDTSPQRLPTAPAPAPCPAAFPVAVAGGVSKEHMPASGEGGAGGGGVGDDDGAAARAGGGRRAFSWGLEVSHLELGRGPACIEWCRTGKGRGTVTANGLRRVVAGVARVRGDAQSRRGTWPVSSGVVVSHGQGERHSHGEEHGLCRVVSQVSHVQGGRHSHGVGHARVMACACVEWRCTVKGKGTVTAWFS